MKDYGKTSIKITMKSKKIIILRSVLLTLIFLWCALIFFMSAETADISSNRSEGLSEKVIGFFLSVSIFLVL